ncbi:MAG: RNA methyltransferase [Deltaproteobacteria bacterium]|nr:RNA methyltransferase [Deltaproteobacteria bacterium]MBN2688173.1 RNA methyltransferase [Deltaproteobacteria bacterium]
MAADRAEKDHVTIILNRPKYAGNIGSVARCMKNTGLRNLSVVTDRTYDREEMLRMSTHCAADIVDNIMYWNTLRDAVAESHYIVGTTARRGSKSARQPLTVPREMAETLAPLSHHNNIALIFGPEDRGLTNDELKFCHTLVTIPTADDLRSLNLSQAVMICCYEILIAFQESVPRFTPRLASSRELEEMYDHLRDMFMTIDFINHENPDYWMMNVRRLLSRFHLHSKEVKIIRGICRHMERYAKKQNA